MDPLRISIFLPCLSGGGAERSMIDLSEKFSLDGHDVTLVVLERKGEYQKFVSERVKLVSLSSKRLIFGIPLIIKYLKKSNSHILITALTHINIGVSIAKLIANHKSKLIITERVSNKDKQFNYNLKFLIMRVLGIILYRFADHVGAVSDGVARDVERYFLLKKNIVHTLYNGLNIREIEKKSMEYSEIKRNYDSQKYIIAAGRLSYQKGFDVLLKSFSFLHEDTKDLKLIILGKGELETNLKELSIELGIKKSVDFLGFVENPYSLFRGSELFVLSSRWEGLPGVLIQAMACGCKVVSTDCDHGPREITNNGMYGELCKVNDVKDLERAMRKCLKIDSYNSKNRASEFSLKMSADGYYKLINCK